MKLMINGIWRGDAQPTPELEAQRMIHAGCFRDQVTPDGASGYRAEAGRYHLYVSYACPFSHRAILAHALKRLERVIGISVVHPIWNTPDGWVFADTSQSTIDGAGNGFRGLHEAYQASRADYTGKITVPVLWDKQARRIVNNESLDIAMILNSAFDGVGGDASVDLAPAARRSELDDWNPRIARCLAVGVYTVAGARNQAEYATAMDELFGCLDDLEAKLDDGRSFLLGDKPTMADVLAFPPLARFDAVYNPLFRASRKQLADYPNLSALTKRFYALPGVAQTLRYDDILTHYYDGDWAIATRRGIVPELPAAMAALDYRHG